MKFQGKVVIVTGGGRGIGRAIVDQFWREGASVAVFDLAPEPPESRWTDRVVAGSEVAAFTVDVRNSIGVNDGVAAVVKRWQRLDVLVNNAAISPVVPLLDMDEETWNNIIDVNLKGVWLCTGAAVPHLRRSGGSVVNISSALALRGAPGNCAYAASKAGVLGMTRALAVELASDGIRVNAVVPGSTDTAMMWGELSPDERRRLEAHVRSRLPIGRLATPDEIARVVIFLASSEASFVTGAMYAVDGGHLARSSVY